MARFSKGIRKGRAERIKEGRERKCGKRASGFYPDNRMD
jgi:hypothetical protein